MLAISVLTALVANLALMPHVARGDTMDMDMSSMDSPMEVGFKATMCDPAKPLEEGCDLYLSFLLANDSSLAWDASESLPNATISLVDMKAGKEDTLVTIDLADGRSGALNTTDGTSYYSSDPMGVKELASHFCMGHIFVDYENEQYRVDSDTDPAGCMLLMGGSEHSADDDHDHSMDDMVESKVDSVTDSGVQATVGAAVVALAGLALF